MFRLSDPQPGSRSPAPAGSARPCQSQSPVTALSALGPWCLSPPWAAGQQRAEAWLDCCLLHEQEPGPDGRADVAPGGDLQEPHSQV